MPPNQQTLFIALIEQRITLMTRGSLHRANGRQVSDWRQANRRQATRRLAHRLKHRRHIPGCRHGTLRAISRAYLANRVDETANARY